ncbi:MAG: hypothetical protein BWY85_00217 [Firmicutes bacterium ADurb.Bin506]|nr:MAG: hypothetical protein BWY85_00217 [Firmicutes bacterium ADurb.Bin506]
MYRYYSTQRPVAPGTFPGKPAELGNYGTNGVDFDRLGHVWGWLDYTEELAPEQASAYELTPAGATPRYYPINEDTARLAKHMNSFSDYVAGHATAEYRRQLDEAAYIAHRQKGATDPMYHDRIDGLLESYARKLAENLNAAHSIDTRCPSVLISGGSNFPVRKKEKQNAARSRNFEEYTYIQGLLDKIRSTGTGGISSDDPNALDKLKAKLADLEESQETMKAVNAYYHKNKTLDGCPHLTEKGATALKASMARDFRTDPKPYEGWALSNNSANIRRVRERIEELEKKASSPAPEGWSFDGGEVVMNTEENRLQILFDDKPDADLRAELKAEAFKWAPSQGAWQRQLTDNALRAAKRIKAIQPTTKGE